MGRGSKGEAGGGGRLEGVRWLGREELHGGRV
jgi:hypothetical protein